ncbi:MAG: fimbria/pilus periplasmic chaperone [Thermodesulfobacteriota bacterium]
MGKLRYSLIFFFLLLLLFPSGARATSFTINPIRVFFKPGQKTDVVKVRNDSERSLSIQLSISEWDQDSEGMRFLSPTTDVIAFPKIFVVEPKKERLVRVGLRVPPGKKEKTYRVYFQEVNNPLEIQTGMTLKTLLKLGVPIYVSPVEIKRSGQIEDMALSNGMLTFKVSNSGTAHIILEKMRIEGIDGSGSIVFTRDSSGRAVLSGRTKFYSEDLSKEDCSKIKSLTLKITTPYPQDMTLKRNSKPLSMSEKLDVLPTMCAP